MSFSGLAGTGGFRQPCDIHETGQKYVNRGHDMMQYDTHVTCSSHLGPPTNMACSMECARALTPTNGVKTCPKHQTNNLNLTTTRRHLQKHRCQGLKHHIFKQLTNVMKTLLAFWTKRGLMALSVHIVMNGWWIARRVPCGKLA